MHPTLTRHSTLLVVITVVIVVAFTTLVTPVKAQDDRNLDGCPTMKLNFGSSVDGVWDAGECESYWWQSAEEGTNTRADFYYFTIEETAFVDVNILADQYALLTLYDSNWDFYADSDYIQNSNINARLWPQIYYLEVMVDEAYQEGADNDYILSLQLLETDECLTNANLDGNGSREGCETDLGSVFNPLVGGVDILSDAGTNADDTPGGCTLGFSANLIVSEELRAQGIVTNSHCTLQLGMNDNTVFYQGSWDNQITPQMGELVDSPLYYPTTPLNSYNARSDARLCRSLADNFECQYSDAAFFKLEEEQVTEFRIARPESINRLEPEEFAALETVPNSSHLRINTQNPYFEVIGIGAVAQGERIHKVGATTDWTTGIVEDVCYSHGVLGDEWPGALLCQVEFISQPGFVVIADGDSGSPVFKCVDEEGLTDAHCSSGLVLLVGLLHSGTDTRGIFSPLASILDEFDKVLGDGVETCWVVDSGGVCGGTIIQMSKSEQISTEPIQEPQVTKEELPVATECPIRLLNSGDIYSDTWGECTSMSNDTDLNSVQDAQFASYSFTLLDSATVNIALMPTTSTAWVTGVYLYDSNWGFLASEESQGTDGASSLEFELAAGGYFVEVLGINRSIAEDPPATFMLTIQAGGALKQAPEEPSIPEQPLVPAPPPPEPPIPEAPEAGIDWNRVIAGTVAVIAACVVLFVLVKIFRRVRRQRPHDATEVPEAHCEYLLNKAHLILKDHNGHSNRDELVAYVAENYKVAIQFTKSGMRGRKIREQTVLAYTPPRDAATNIEANLGMSEHNVREEITLADTLLQDTTTDTRVMSLPSVKLGLDKYGSDGRIICWELECKAIATHFWVTVEPDTKRRWHFACWQHEPCPNLRKLPLYYPAYYSSVGWEKCYESITGFYGKPPACAWHACVRGSEIYFIARGKFVHLLYSNTGYCSLHTNLDRTTNQTAD